ncbi:NLR family CARD domain-containing protein 4 [Chionoecetes opilio]|uniref:NLR family CARD domain-containing protein 4 n=1 Tax=Chionoecetes opilio TaxID=41210 RepID=A0A8J5CZZ4_CHIOP|nr:NLR family CARD domain-containing protein 4 [Chionoecetes opilio]
MNGVARGGGGADDADDGLTGGGEEEEELVESINTSLSSTYLSSSSSTSSSSTTSSSFNSCSYSSTSKNYTRYLVEGEPGMGKTLLALKLAIDWANKKSLQEFKFVFLIFLRDFKGSLEQYVREELLPSHFQEKFRQVWEYCKEHEEQVLFILDGYDELQKQDEGDIRKLLHNHQDFQNSKVVVTARPDVLKSIAERTVVKGFSEAQMIEFITKYFRLVNEDENGRCLRKIMEKDGKYRKLAERPLFCVLLCMLYGSVGASKLPDRLSDMMFKIMLCLIKWNIKKVDLQVDDNIEAFPVEYEAVFLSFGKLCLDALQTEKTRFNDKEIREAVDNPGLLLHLGFLSSDSENNVLGHKKFWKPVHKIFLEYLAGLYMAQHIQQHHRTPCRQCRDFSAVYRHEHVLKFVVGILGKNAHLALDYRRLQAPLHMKDQQLLMLLRETEATRENCRAIAKLLDRRNAVVYTSDVDFEGWRYILAQNFKHLKSLEIVWRIKSSNPDQRRVPSKRLLQRVLNKESLKELEIKELNMMASEPLRRALEGATCNMDRKALESLEKLHLDMYLRDEDLEVICDRLKRCATNLRELQLRGIEHGYAGFRRLVELLKKNKNLHTLCRDVYEQGAADVRQRGFHDASDLHGEQVHMPRHANKKSKDAFRQEQQQEQKPACCPAPPQYPTRELSYLFGDHLNTGAKHSVEARCYYFVCGGSETRLPLPLCISSQHESVFHMLFTAVAESSLHHLTLVDPCLYLTTADLVCLGDAIRRTKHLSMLRLSGLTVTKHYIPILLGLGQCQSLKTVRLESPCVTITDTAYQLACTALRHNTSLRSLSLAHWEFCLQWSGVKTLRLSEVKVKESPGFLQRGHLLLPIVRGCPNYEADVERDSGYSMEGSDMERMEEVLGWREEARRKRRREEEEEEEEEEESQVVRKIIKKRYFTFDHVVLALKGITSTSSVIIGVGVGGVWVARCRPRARTLALLMALFLGLLTAAAATSHLPQL